MIHVLVTGGNGQLASCIKDAEKKYEGLNIIYTDYEQLDICNLNQVRAFFKDNKGLKYCINCAAYTAVDAAEADDKKALEINAVGAKNLALVCKEEGVVLIHISTDFVFSGENIIPYIETDETLPISAYGSTKLQGELEVQQILKEHFIIRTSWLYSQYGGNFVKTMLRLAETKSRIGVVSDQFGSPTNANDLAKVIMQIIDTGIHNYGVYHYSNEGEVSWYDFAKTIFKHKNIDINVSPISTKEFPTPAARPKYSVLNKSKIKNILSIEIPNWEDSLKECLISLN